MIQYDLTYKQAQKLSFDYSLSLGIKINKSWSDNQLAGIEWMKGFMKRHPSLSLRKPENTSHSRATSFNQVNVSEFFVNYEKALRKHKIPPNQIFNTDETGLSIVMQTPRLVAPKGIKQIGQAVSAERGEIITFCAMVGATNNTIPPVFIFPRVWLQKEFLNGSLEGSLGLAKPFG